MYKLCNGDDVLATSENPITYSDEHRGWVTQNQIVIDTDLAFTVETPAPKVSPVEFKLLFTAQERVAIKAARASDPIIDDFFEIAEDPRLTYVDLGLESTQAALSYLVTKELITEVRKADILAGVIK